MRVTQPAFNPEQDKITELSTFREAESPKQEPVLNQTRSSQGCLVKTNFTTDSSDLYSQNRVNTHDN